jgi:hypothetical protein
MEQADDFARALAISDRWKSDGSPAFRFRFAMWFAAAAGCLWIGAIGVDAANYWIPNRISMAMRLGGAAAISIVLILRLWRRTWRVPNERNSLTPYA